MKHIRPIDVAALAEAYRNAMPFPFFVLDDFLATDFAKRVAAAYPDYQTARTMGLEFDAVNERLKVQITESSKFPDPVWELAEDLSSPDFLALLERVTGIPRLLADPSFSGGGMHLTGPTGRLDVHVDFNFLSEKAWHRRLNILVYLNPEWRPEWGGNIELWDRDVKHCIQSLEPIFNRCVVFETSEISFHGVTPITCPRGYTRQSFAAYYYTQEAPAAWNGRSHSTIFRARPDEKLRGRVLMPIETAYRQLGMKLNLAKSALKRVIGRS